MIAASFRTVFSSAQVFQASGSVQSVAKRDAALAFGLAGVSISSLEEILLTSLSVVARWLLVGFLAGCSLVGALVASSSPPCHLSQFITVITEN